MNRGQITIPIAIAVGIFASLLSGVSAYYGGQLGMTEKINSSNADLRVTDESLAGKFQTLEISLNNNTKNDTEFKDSINKQLDSINDKLDTLLGWNKVAMPAN